MVILALVLFAPVSIALCVVDIREHRLPNRLVGIALVTGAMAFGVAGDWSRYAIAWFSALLLFLSYLIAHLFSRGGLGLGDVKLAAVLGLYLGYLSWPLVWTASLIALLVAGITTSIGLAFGRMNLKSRVPFGPFMLLGFWLAVIPIDSALLGRWAP